MQMHIIFVQLLCERIRLGWEFVEEDKDSGGYLCQVSVADLRVPCLTFS